MKALNITHCVQFVNIFVLFCIFPFFVLYCFYLRTSDAFINKIIVIVIVINSQHAPTLAPLHAEHTQCRISAGPVYARHGTGQTDRQQRCLLL